MYFIFFGCLMCVFFVFAFSRTSGGHYCQPVPSEFLPKSRPKLDNSTGFVFQILPMEFFLDLCVLGGWEIIVLCRGGGFRTPFVRKTEGAKLPNLSPTLTALRPSIVD